MRWQYALLSLALLGGLSVPGQRTNPATGSDQQTPTAPVRNPHSTKADKAVPLCPAMFDDGLDKDGVATVREDNVTDPKGEGNVPPQIPDEVRREFLGRQHSWKVGLKLLIGPDGKPQDVCITESAGYGLDAHAAQTVLKYKFDPATKDGKPVPIRVTIFVDFKIVS